MYVNLTTESSCTLQHAIISVKFCNGNPGWIQVHNFCGAHHTIPTAHVNVHRIYISMDVDVFLGIFMNAPIIQKGTCIRVKGLFNLKK